MAHIQRLIANDPKATKWHLMLDNLNIHQSESLVRWVAQQEITVSQTIPQAVMTQNELLQIGQLKVQVNWLEKNRGQYPTLDHPGLTRKRREKSAVPTQTSVPTTTIVPIVPNS